MPSRTDPELTFHIFHNEDGATYTPEPGGLRRQGGKIQWRAVLQEDGPLRRICTSNGTYETVEAARRDILLIAGPDVRIIDATVLV